MKKIRLIRHSKTFIGALVFFVASVMIISAFLTFLILFALKLLQIVPDIRMATMTLPFLALAVSIVIGICVSFVVSRTLLRPIHCLIKGTRAVAKGDFTVKIDTDGTAGEMRELIESFNVMTKELSGIEIFKNDFINTFSHEFKTPIVSISGFARQLKYYNLTDEEKNEYTDIIINESERLSKMASSILLLSKLENQNIISDRVTYSLDEQIRSCILLFQKQWENKNLQLNIELESIIYTGNQDIMQHVWINLIENAVKFCTPDGEITVKSYMKYNRIHVIIANDCPPLRREALEHIFDKFFQADSSHSSDGNGLGLALVKRIIQLCGGAVTVESSKKGISFDIELPADETG